MKIVNIPEEIYDPFFFTEKKIPVSLEAFPQKELFVFEIAYYSGLDSDKPWEDAEKFVPELIKAWEELEIEIKSLFDHRDKQGATLPMKRGIGYLIEFIFWTNGHPARRLDQFEIESLQLKPVNFFERLQFILKRPSIYPSYIQLKELMEEQQKQFSKYLAITKTKK